MGSKILIACHGPLASALKASAELIIGAQPRILTAPPYDGDTEALDDSLSSGLQGTAPDGQLVVLTDLLGGSVNTRYAAAADKRITLVTGANLGLVIELANALDDLAEEGVLAEILDRAREGIVSVEASTDTTEEDF